MSRELLDLVQKLVATATFLDGSKTNFRSFIYCHSSNIPANLVKIGLIDIETCNLGGLKTGMTHPPGGR